MIIRGSREKLQFRFKLSKRLFVVQKIISRASDGVSRGVAPSHQKQEGFIDKLLNRRDLVALIRIRLKQKVENRVSPIFGLSNTFLAPRLDLVNPFGALLATH